jgi:hypothetical protein
MRRKSSKSARLLLVALSTAFLASNPLRSQTPEATDVLLRNPRPKPIANLPYVTCHTATDSPTMHSTGTVRLGCIDCHGGNAEIRLTADTRKILRNMPRPSARPSSTEKSR